MLEALRLSRLLQQCTAEGAKLAVFPGTRWSWTGTTRREGCIVLRFGATSSGKPEGIIIASYKAFWDKLKVRFQTLLLIIAGRLRAVQGKSANGLIDLLVIGGLSRGEDHTEESARSFYSACTSFVRSAKLRSIGLEGIDTNARLGGAPQRPWVGECGLP